MAAELLRTKQVGSHPEAVQLAYNKKKKETEEPTPTPTPEVTQPSEPKKQSFSLDSLYENFKVQSGNK